MATIFSRIVSGELPCYKIYEDKDYLAFLDINPLKTGHTLVIPKKEINYIFDMEEALYQGLFLFAKKIAGAIDKAVPCERIGVAVIGLEVPHAHIHLVPINHVGDIDFTQPKMKSTAEELTAVAEKIKANL